jgi:hypothetical protein
LRNGGINGVVCLFPISHRVRLASCLTSLNKTTLFCNSARLGACRSDDSTLAGAGLAGAGSRLNILTFHVARYELVASERYFFGTSVLCLINLVWAFAKSAPFRP